MEQPQTTHESINSKCCCFNMRRISRAVTQYFDRQLEPAGIRATQFTLLVELSTVSAKTLTEIANGLVMDRTTLTRNLKPLEKQGFISNFQPADKRAKAYLEVNVHFYPDESRTYVALGDFYAKEKEKKEAIANYKKAIEIDGNKDAKAKLKKLTK